MAGLVLEADGFPNPQQVQECMEAYGMRANPEDGLRGVRQVSRNTMLVMDWMMYVSANTYLAGAFYFPCQWMGVHSVCQTFGVHSPEDFRRMPDAFQRRMAELMRTAAPGIDWDAALSGRIPMYGLTRAPLEGKGNGKGKGILSIMDARIRPNL